MAPSELLPSKIKMCISTSAAKNRRPSPTLQCQLELGSIFFTYCLLPKIGQRIWTTNLPRPLTAANQKKPLETTQQ